MQVWLGAHVPSCATSLRQTMAIGQKTQFAVADADGQGWPTPSGNRRDDVVMTGWPPPLLLSRRFRHTCGPEPGRRCFARRGARGEG